MVRTLWFGARHMSVYVLILRKAGMVSVLWCGMVQSERFADLIWRDIVCHNGVHLRPHMNR